MDLYRNTKSAYVLIYDLSKHFSNELMVSVTGSKFHTSNMTILYSMVPFKVNVTNQN